MTKAQCKELNFNQWSGWWHKYIK